jgi:hypothetical protein
MITARPATHLVGTRQERRTQRRRKVREQLLAVAVLVVVFAITVLLLSLQWLDAGSSGAAHAGSASGRAVVPVFRAVSHFPAVSNFPLSEVH